MPEVRANQPTPPRAKYAAIMAITTLAAMGCAAGVATIMGAPGRVALLAAMAAMAVAGGSLATFLPAILKVERQSWGLVVLASSMARTMLILVFALFFDKTRELGDGRTALWIGAMIGAGVVLLIESAVSIRILAALERSASALKMSDQRPAAHA